MSLFSFFIVNANILNTRSKHEDTDYLALTVKVGNNTQFAFKALGNHNSGSFAINLAILGVDLEPGASLVFNYMIVNAGSTNASAAQTALKAAGAAWANGAGPASTNLVGALQDGQTFFTTELKNILNTKSCDGMVAAEQNHFTYQQLTGMMTNNILAHQTHHAGVLSPGGCGPNSQYNIGWEIDEQTPLQ
jgi:hypothetical protein